MRRSVIFIHSASSNEIEYVNSTSHVPILWKCSEGRNDTPLETDWIVFYNTRSYDSVTVEVLSSRRYHEQPEESFPVSISWCFDDGDETPAMYSALDTVRLESGQST